MPGATRRQSPEAGFRFPILPAERHSPPTLQVYVRQNLEDHIDSTPVRHVENPLLIIRRAVVDRLQCALFFYSRPSSLPAVPMTFMPAAHAKLPRGQPDATTGSVDRSGE